MGEMASAPQSGYVWDEASGYYYDAASGYYYDGNSGLHLLICLSVFFFEQSMSLSVKCILFEDSFISNKSSPEIKSIAILAVV